jgi:adenosylcobinamide amidohydrolase
LLSVKLEPPFLLATFPVPHRVLSWSMLRPGFHTAHRVAWLEIHNRDLPHDVDAGQLIRDRVGAAGLDDAVVFVTSRDIHRHHLERVAVETERATCLTTVGLSNSERVGVRLHQPPPVAGTINTLVQVSRPLSEAALIEAVSIATEARTAAVLDSGERRQGVAVTGTGTDCIAIAAPLGDDAAVFAGKHTAIGECIGAAVYKATTEGIRAWRLDFAALMARSNRQMAGPA